MFQRRGGGGGGGERRRIVLVENLNWSSLLTLAFHARMVRSINEKRN